MEGNNTAESHNITILSVIFTSQWRLSGADLTTSVGFVPFLAKQFNLRHVAQAIMPLKHPGLANGLTGVII